MSKSANKRLGTHMEERRAEARRAAHTPEQEWHDLEDGDTPVEVKTTKRTVQSGDRERPGRYQLEGENHHQLVEQGGEYDFVLRDSEGDVVDVVTKEAAQVEKLLTDAGRKWPVGSKLKLQWTAIHTERAAQ